MKVMRFNAASEEEVKVNGEELEDVDSFVYLGAKISTAGAADDDINSRLCKARVVNCRCLEKQHPEQKYHD